MERNLGLDTARAAAIVLVLITHGSTFFFWNHYDVLAFSYVTGYYGVEIFFVLSGFLIGKIIMKEIVENGSWKALLRFYVRRWFRTLPLYFFVLAVTWLLLERSFHWLNFVFLQNFNEQALNDFMPVSWSLTIEEWFYLLIPFFLLLLCLGLNAGFGADGSNPARKRARLVIGLCVWMIIGELFFRFFYVLAENPLWDSGVRKNIPLRLDSLVAGVLLAALQRYRRSVYDRLRSPVSIVLALGVLYACGAFVYEQIHNNTMDQSYFARTALFTVVSLAFAVCIAWLEGSRAFNSPVLSGHRVGKAITFLSVTSYAAYLTHWEIFIYYKDLVVEPKLRTSYGLWASAIVIVFAVSFLLHKTLEKPFMNLRDRLPGFLSGAGVGSGSGHASPGSATISPPN